MGASTPARNLAVGSTLHQGKFTVGRVLGEGGFGITYKGAHRDLRRPVAIKELFPLDLGASRLGTRVSVPALQADAFRYARDQALQEARIIAGFRSRNIVDVYDMFLENGTAYIVMEYLEGETLEARLERVGCLSLDEVQGLAEALCEALAEVHDGNWLHRDIKPANIVLAGDQRVVLIDFGSAREFHLHRTQRHTRILTAQYAAPEQYSEAARFGPYTDAFSLGATLYHALTGAPPPSAMDRFQSGRDLDFPSGVPSRLAAALQQALALRVDDRPASMTELLALASVARPASDGTEDAARGTAPDFAAGAAISVLPPRLTYKVGNLPLRPRTAFPVRNLDLIRTICVHHSNAPASIGPEQLAQAIMLDQRASDAPLPGLPYHFFIHPDGQIDHCVDLTHTCRSVAPDGNQNERIVSVCLAGKFTQVLHPTSDQMKQARRLIAWLMQKHYIGLNDVQGHKDIDVSERICPGEGWDQGRNWKATLFHYVELHIGALAPTP